MREGIAVVLALVAYTMLSTGLVLMKKGIAWTGTWRPSDRAWRRAFTVWTAGFPSGRHIRAQLGKARKKTPHEGEVDTAQGETDESIDYRGHDTGKGSDDGTVSGLERDGRGFCQQSSCQNCASDDRSWLKLHGLTSVGSASFRFCSPVSLTIRGRR